MVKKVSIAVIIIAIIIGGVTIYFKTTVPAEGETVKGEQIELTQSVSNPKDSFDKISSPSGTGTPTISQPKAEKGPNSMEIDATKTYQAVLQTSLGDITISLNASQTPITVNNFVALARKSFYDNTIFHRTIKGFMIQGGDPKGNGTGGPGYTFADEPFTGEYTKGTVAMANAGPNTNGSQFFIMHKDYALPKNYVIFGKVTKGMDVVDKIAESPTKPGGEGSTPVSPVIITSMIILEQ